MLLNINAGTNRQLKFDNASSCSLMLSKSGASSTIKESNFLAKSKNNINKFAKMQRFQRESSCSSNPQILQSFASTFTNN